jgi:hypothetical protein
MATVKHPVSGKPQLVWEPTTHVVRTAYVEQQAKYSRGTSYAVRETFALVRPNYRGDFTYAQMGTGWVVTRNNFDEIREFETFDMAKLYVESLFALEYNN